MFKKLRDQIYFRHLKGYQEKNLEHFRNHCIWVVYGVCVTYFKVIKHQYKKKIEFLNHCRVFSLINLTEHLLKGELL